ncbi:DUF6009 family protein [Streptomyces sp. NBC_00564]|uniref:DUF6009 family protein n=1 Tax=Streptomyces sp. NBC_00564 TaxID=2903663 RepID=UPI00352FAEBE
MERARLAVGYAILRADAPGGVVLGKYVRRVFWVRKHAPSEYPDGVTRRQLPMPP